MEEFEIINSYLCVRMPKELDHHAATKIRETADKYIEGERVEHVVFDFQYTNFMDSSGIGVIMGRYKKMKTLGGKVFAIHTNERIRKIFQMSGLTKMIETIDEEERL